MSHNACGCRAEEEISQTRLVRAHDDAICVLRFGEFRNLAARVAIDHYGFGMGYGWDTFLGPVELKYTYSPETGNSVWFVNVGFSF